MGMVVSRFDIYLVNLDPTIGKGIKKSRPCVVISPDEMNRHIATVTVAPMTTKARSYPTRIACKFEGKNGQVVLDQIRTINKARLIKKLGKVNRQTQKSIFIILNEMFSN